MATKLEGLITNHAAEGGAIAPYRLVKVGSNNRAVVQASADADLFVGVSDSIGADAEGDPIDVIRSGIAEIEYGGSVTRGQPLTADADGKAVAAAPDAGANAEIIGWAEVSGVAGDIGSVFIERTRIQG
ncbi:MAG: hypothetical protein ACOC0M_00395 [Halomonas sp.]